MVPVSRFGGESGRSRRCARDDGSHKPQEKPTSLRGGEADAAIWLDWRGIRKGGDWIGLRASCPWSIGPVSLRSSARKRVLRFREPSGWFQSLPPTQTKNRRPLRVRAPIFFVCIGRGDWIGLRASCPWSFGPVSLRSSARKRVLRFREPPGWFHPVPAKATKKGRFTSCESGLFLLPGRGDRI